MNELLATPPLHTSSWLSKSEDFTISKTQLNSSGLLYSGTAPFDGFCTIKILNKSNENMPSNGWNIIIDNNTKLISASSSRNGLGTIGVICPVAKGDEIMIYGSPNLSVRTSKYISI